MLQMNEVTAIAPGPMLDIAVVLPRLALATAIGLLIGAERGWRMRDEEPGSRVAGVRTFTMLGLLGGMASLAAAIGLGAVAALIVVGAIAMLMIGYHAQMRTEANLSVTSAVAAMATMLLGALATAGEMALASVGAGTMVALLASREALHAALAKTTRAEMTALVRMALVVFLILPLLPDAELGPFGGINPRRIWFVVVVTGGISLAGYAIARWQGGRNGTLMMAGVGALVSSTAVTLEAARRLREGHRGPAENGAVSLASLVMIARVLLLTAVVAPAVALSLAAMLAPGLAVAAAFAALHLWQAFGLPAREGPAIRPPTLTLAFVFAGVVAVLTLAVRWAELRLGEGSGAFVIALGGALDVDSAIAAVGALPRGALPVRLAALAIAAPVALNTAFKLALLMVIAGPRRGFSAGAPLLLTAAAVAGAAVLLAP